MISKSVAGSQPYPPLRNRYRLYHRARPRASLSTGRPFVRRRYRLCKRTEKGSLGAPARRHLGRDGCHRNGSGRGTLTTVQGPGLPPHRRLRQGRASHARASRQRCGTAAQIDRHAAQPVRVSGSSGYGQLPRPCDRQPHRPGRQGERLVARADQTRTHLRGDRGRAWVGDRRRPA